MQAVHDTQADWLHVIHHTAEVVREAVGAVVRQHQRSLADLFYSSMLGDGEAAQFLSNAVVEERLHPAIQRWMNTLFSDGHGDPVAMAALQRQVGAVHARAEIPVGLVSRGMRLLKGEICDRLVHSELARGELVQAVTYVGEMMDLAMGEMSGAYMVAHERIARTDEVFRMVAAGQNLALERQKQLGAMTEWENDLLRALATGASVTSVTGLRASALGLWTQHKAPLLFDDSTELPRILEHILHVDETLVPLLAHVQLRSEQASTVTNALRDCMATLEEIRFLINSMFDRMVDMEVGRDVLTQLYNRRFLPTILRRELEIARRQQVPFAVLMIDVDHFKRVNDEHGHEAGDRVLQHISAMLTAQARVSDFFFRYGGEEFLAVLTEVDLARAQAVAEKVRMRVAASDIPLSEKASIRVSVSIGVAAYDGHPDYRHLIGRADAALYQAKQNGRNQVQCADLNH